MTTQEQPRTRLYTVKEMAELLAVPESWVYSHVAAGDIPHLKVGRYVRFNRNAVMQWLEGPVRDQ